MRRGLYGIALGLALFSAQAAASNINLFLGGKGLNQDDWLADSHGEVGVMIDIEGPDWPIAIAVDFLSSSGEFSGYVYDYWSDSTYYYEEEVRTREFDVGVRKYWYSGSDMYPYFGGGIAFIDLEAEARPAGGPLYKDEGSGQGIWLGGGILWGFDQLNIGFDIRSSVADVDLKSGNYAGGGGHIGLVLGFNF